MGARHSAYLADVVEPQPHNPHHHQQQHQQYGDTQHQLGATAPGGGQQQQQPGTSTTSLLLAPHNTSDPPASDPPAQPTPHQPPPAFSFPTDVVNTVTSSSPQASARPRPPSINLNALPPPALGLPNPHPQPHPQALQQQQQQPPRRWLPMPLCGGGVDTADLAATHPHSPLPSPAASGLVDVWVVAGQSNAVGENQPDGIPMPSAAQPLPGLVLMYDSNGRWRDAVPNIHTGLYGYEHQDSCGPAMALGRTLVGLGLSSRVGLVPAARGATSLYGDWRPGGELYGNMIGRTKAALAGGLPGGGSGRLRGMVWVQGEADADEEAHAAVYGANFAAFAAAVRRDLAPYHAQLPILLGVMPTRKRSCFPHIDTVRQQQLQLRLPGLVKYDMAGLEFFEEFGGFHVHLTKDGACALGAALAHVYYAHVVRAGLPRGPAGGAGRGGAGGGMVPQSPLGGAEGRGGGGGEHGRVSGSGMSWGGAGAGAREEGVGRVSRNGASMGGHVRVKGGAEAEAGTGGEDWAGARGEGWGNGRDEAGGAGGGVRGAEVPLNAQGVQAAAGGGPATGDAGGGSEPCGGGACGQEGATSSSAAGGSSAAGAAPDVVGPEQQRAGGGGGGEALEDPCGGEAGGLGCGGGAQGVGANGGAQAEEAAVVGGPRAGGREEGVL